ncbi:MAG: hypothetical protein KDJ52_04015 [Anaerolineae bacterium]|nr:hypothetical protein [Anaerolineae bacterium]
MQNLYYYRKYIWQNALQDLRHRYAGSALGYVETILAERVLSILCWNPAYYFIKSFRDLFLFNQIPPWNAWAIMMAWAAIFVFLATWVLHRTRPKLRDLL